MKKGILVLTLLLTFTTNSFADSCEMTDRFFSGASKVRGLAIKNKVPCFEKGLEAVKEDVKQLIDKDELKHAALLYKALGLVPDDYDFEKNYIDYTLANVAGLYDQKNKRFLIMDSVPMMLRPIVMVHELTHALQDQHYDLENFADEKKLTTDEELARSALLEGDATAVMMDYTTALVGRPPLSEQKDVSSSVLQNVISARLTTTLTAAPKSVSLLLMFPYNSGLNFVQQQLYGKGYAVLDNFYKNPPRSTEEILHPEKYGKQDFKSFSDKEVLREFSENDNLQISYSDVMGEFFIKAMLFGAGIDVEQNLGWGGDRAVVLNNNEVLWLTAWDSKEQAEKFFNGYQKLIEKRYAAQVDNGHKLELSGNKVLQINHQEDKVLIKVLFNA